MGAFAFAAHHAADVRFVNLDVIAAREVAADAVAALADHARRAACAGFGRPSRTGSGQAGAGTARPTCRASCWTRDRRPKTTSRQRRMGALHHGTDRQRRLLAARAAGQHARARGQADRLALFLAMRANEAFRPLRALKVARARVIVGEKPLELDQRLGERQVFPLENVGRGGLLPRTKQRWLSKGETRAATTSNKAEKRRIEAPPRSQPKPANAPFSQPLLKKRAGTQSQPCVAGVPARQALSVTGFRDRDRLIHLAVALRDEPGLMLLPSRDFSQRSRASNASASCRSTRRIDALSFESHSSKSRSLSISSPSKGGCVMTKPDFEGGLHVSTR